MSSRASTFIVLNFGLAGWRQGIRYVSRQPRDARHVRGNRVGAHESGISILHTRVSAYPTVKMAKPLHTFSARAHVVAG
jgi:hypothetical protein